MALSVQSELKERGIHSKLISVPCQELFDEKSNEYKDKLIEKDNLIISIEAGSVSCWHKYLNRNDIAIGIDNFGKSAPYKEIFSKMKLTSHKITSLIQEKLRK